MKRSMHGVRGSQAVLSGKLLLPARPSFRRLVQDLDWWPRLPGDASGNWAPYTPCDDEHRLPNLCIAFVTNQQRTNAGSEDSSDRLGAVMPRLWTHVLVLAAVIAGGCDGSRRNSPKLLDLDELGPAEQVGDPLEADWKADEPLPVSVDHAPLLPPVRDQGDTNLCMSFAIAAAVEGFYGLTEYLSVQQLADDFNLSIDAFLSLRLRGYRMAPERYYPFGGGPEPEFQLHRDYEIERYVGTGVGETKLMTYLAERPQNNIVVGLCMLPEAYGNPGYIQNPDVAWPHFLNCRLTSGSGGHAVLLVGYAPKPDTDGVTRTFFKFKNSWGVVPGDPQDGYGWISSEYVRKLALWGHLVRPSR